MQIPFVEAIEAKYWDTTLSGYLLVVHLRREPVCPDEVVSRRSRPTSKLNDPHEDGKMFVSVA